DWAATQLEASKEDLVWEGDTIHVQGSPEPNLTLFEIARQMEESGAGLKLESKTRSDIPGASFPFGAYGAEVAIDVSTGNVKLKRVIAVDDAGTIINPLLAEGQIVGGTLQGVASALWEEMVYNEDGLPVTASFLDYLVPSTAESDFDSENEFTSTPTPYTALGAKGVGESGTVGALAAVANAVNACLGKLGFEGHLDPPYSPQKIWNSVGSVSKQ
ncbi:MAG: molybdopterin-dependent oxidoreductase, partial [Actinomycetota bacterium]|nr:molybdopterin-dependent oxidoreductase [Actinomycetota bacterium]